MQDRATGTLSVEIDGVPFAVDGPAFDENTGELCPEHERDEPTPLVLRREILARDGFRCCHCRSRRNLTVHHRLWLRYGGRTVRENLMTLCEDCHSLVHARLLVIVGTIPGRLRFVDRRGAGTAAAGGSSREAMKSVVVETEPAEVVSRETTHAEGSESVSRETSLTLEAFVGQAGAVRNIRRAVDRARRRGKPMPHTLLCGPAGLGKSSLARALAVELGTGFRMISAPMVRESEDLLRHLVALRDRDILFLDEVHRLPVHVAEMLYEAMQDRRISGPGGGVRIARFSLIGATTEEDLPPAPLRSRFQVRQDLSYYSETDLAEIVRRSAASGGLEIDATAAVMLARASRETPREALALLRNVCDEADLRGVTALDAAIVGDVLRSLEIDDDGLGRIDREYLLALRQVGIPLSLSTLADRLGKSRGAIERVHEPFLIRRGLIVRTIRGRVLA
jgi:Holliday junction DNA helicase RuvB